MNKLAHIKRPSLLDKGHDARAFDCGEIALNNFLKESAWHNQLRNTATTYVLLEDNNIIAYYSLTIGAFMHQGALEPTVNEFSAYNIPAVFISRLAVDQKRQKQKIGSHFLQDALARASTIAQSANIKIIVANALNEKAKKFYRQFNFEPWLIDDYRLFLLLKDLRKTFN